GYQTEINGYNITNTKIKNGTTVVYKENTKIDPETQSTKENDKTPVLLPKTGGTPKEVISIVGGILLLVLGVILFVRRRIQ
ncbi:LPXTG cell wall anchor domain-containing protein, partial [Bacillus wiedmannii]|uniref:LPXTG cell wall anchor domain-containing protein n=1 Tax=Bacillus wiedmannii TaxID=1890302 RepID=UPI0010BD327B